MLNFCGMIFQLIDSILLMENQKTKLFHFIPDTRESKK